MKVLLTLHLVAAIFLIGPVVAAGMTGLRALRTQDAAAARLTARMTTVYGWASIVVALLGASMVRGRESGWHIAFGDTWVYVSVLLYLASLVVSLVLVAPAFREAAQRLDSGLALGSLQARAASTAIAVNVLFLAIIVLMVYKP